MLGITAVDSGILLLTVLVGDLGAVLLVSSNLDAGDTPVHPLWLILLSIAGCPLHAVIAGVSFACFYQFEVESGLV